MTPYKNFHTYGYKPDNDKCVLITYAADNEHHIILMLWNGEFLEYIFAKETDYVEALLAEAEELRETEQKALVENIWKENI